jgi:dTDP-4-dehydrorhamnose reductase
MKIVLFGSNGMLGTYLNKYLSSKYEIIPLTRKELNLSKIDDTKSYIRNIITNNDIIINAAGVIKQRDYNPLDMILVNSVFPNILAEIKTEIKCNVIHITTDCVFNGNTGEYTENDAHDCLDDYGKSKSLGENPINTNIRTSIIGEEKYNKKSLLEWVKSNKGKIINGYENHLWNGVTCLELSKQIQQIIINKNYWNGTRHIFSPNTVNKFELSNIINEIYNLEIIINKFNTNSKCYRNLKSIYNNPVKLDLFNQIKEMKEFLL